MSADLEILKTCAREFLESESCGHDFLHCMRVAKHAEQISREEFPSVNLNVIKAAALMHDICRPWESKTGRSHFCEEALTLIEAQLYKSGFDLDMRVQILDVIRWHDVYDPARLPSASLTAELRIHQDADRLDAIGAIGIARVFAFGGARSRPLYVPGENLNFNDYFVESPDRRTSTIAHFYEKLLKLRDEMHTDTGKRLAIVRHQRMEQFLDDFFDEWQVSD